MVPFERPKYEELIECLREKLAQAERGELGSFAYACEYTNGETGHYAFHDVGSNVYKIVGIIEALKIRIASRHLQADPGGEKLGPEGV